MQIGMKPLTLALLAIVALFVIAVTPIGAFNLGSFSPRSYSSEGEYFNITIMNPRNGSTLFVNHTDFSAITDVDVTCTYNRCICVLTQNWGVMCGCQGPLRMKETGETEHYVVVRDLYELTGNQWHELQLVCRDSANHTEATTTKFFVNLLAVERVYDYL